MKAGIVSSIRKAEVVEIGLPEISDQEILVKVEACAICTFEQRIFDGVKKVNYPYLGGHEISGTIARTGKNISEKWAAGQRVAVKTLDQCGQCRYCHMGETTMCEMIGKSGRRVPEMDGIGGLAEFIKVTPNMIFPLPEDIPPEVAALTEPLACVIHSMDRAAIDFGDTVVVFGAGIMGLLHLELALLRGARVIVSEVDLRRRQRAQALGAWKVINPLEINVSEWVKENTKGEGADVVISTPNLPGIVLDAMDMVRSGGKIVLYGSYHPDVPVPISLNKIHYSQIILTGAVNPGNHDFQRATRMIAGRIIDLGKYVDAVYCLDEIQKAYEESLNPLNYRVVVSFCN